MSSPILQVNPNSLDALFNKNPLELSDEEVDRIVAAEQEDRLRWKPEEKKKSKVAAPANLSLDDLDIKL